MVCLRMEPATKFTNTINVNRELPRIISKLIHLGCSCYFNYNILLPYILMNPYFLSIKHPPSNLTFSIINFTWISLAHS